MGAGARLFCPNPKCSMFLVGRLGWEGRKECGASSWRGAGMAAAVEARQAALLPHPTQQQLYLLTLPLSRLSHLSPPLLLQVADDKRADQAIACPYCDCQLCANCGVAWHKGMTCQQYQASCRGAAFAVPCMCICGC